MSFTFLLPLMLAGGSNTGADEESLRELIRQSNECLNKEIEERVPANMMSVTADERSSIRMDAVQNCDEYNGRIALYTKEYRMKIKSLDDVTQAMRVNSLQIADAMLQVLLKSKTSERSDPR